MSSRGGHDFRATGEKGLVCQGDSVCRKCGMRVRDGEGTRVPCPFPDDPIEPQRCSPTHEDLVRALERRVAYEQNQSGALGDEHLRGYVKGLEKALRIVTGQDEP